MFKFSKLQLHKNEMKAGISIVLTLEHLDFEFVEKPGTRPKGGSPEDNFVLGI